MKNLFYNFLIIIWVRERAVIESFSIEDAHEQKIPMRLLQTYNINKDTGWLILANIRQKV